MPTIRILPDRVANQIAAGEVVERPSAVVKELVENSLDAGATRITVEFRHGGRAFISVADNGRGMDREDAMLCLERHATSKISNAGDLDALATFGFRGEALPSIASVSQFVLQTRTSDAAEGTEVSVNGGRLLHVRECGVPQGTRVSVSSLFNSVPARRKFLKTDTTEAAHIIQCVRYAALANPSVAFTLIEDERTVFESPVCASLEARVAEIFGKQIAEGLIPVAAQGDGLRLSGLIGRPGASRATRQDMVTFVNRRPVDSRTLAYAILESYQMSLPKGRYPLAFLFLEIDPAQVDVNVHPAKREVRFRSEPYVRTFVVSTLLETLRRAASSWAGEISPKASAPVAPLLPERPVPVAAFRPPENAVRATPPITPRVASISPVVPAVPTPRAVEVVAPTAPVAVEKPTSAGWKFLGEALGEYAIFETARGVVLLDTRAAAERIVYEEIESAFRDGAQVGQRLLFSVPVELDPIASALLIDHKDFLAKHGLEVAVFGKNFFRIESVPLWLEEGDAERLLRDVLSYVREGKIDPRRPELAREVLARLAAVRAVRGEWSRDAHGLAAKLLSCRQPLLTPSGKPTLIELGRSELARRFGK